MKKMYIVTFICLVVALLFWLYSGMTGTYVNNYYSKVGISDIGILTKSYNDILNELGAPINEKITSENEKELVYENYSLKFILRKEEYILSQVVIRNGEIKFGNFSIGVGSRKLGVLLAYRLKPNNTTEENSVIRYRDGEYWVEFKYNDDNTVDEMRFSIADIS